MSLMPPSAPTDPVVFDADRLDFIVTVNQDEPWYGDWRTIGNIPGSIGFAGQPTSAPATTIGSGGVTLPLSNASVPISDCSALSATGGSFTVGGQIIVYSGRSTSSGAGNATGCYTLPTASGSYGSGTVLGYTTIGFGAISFYQNFGQDTPNAPIPGTTQVGYLLGNYFGPTVDDSMEGFSVFVAAKDTGTPYTQSRPITGFESAVQVEGGNTASDYMLGVGSRVKATGTAVIANGVGMKSSGWTEQNGDATLGVMTAWKAFYDDRVNPAGTTPNNNLSVSGKNFIHSEQGFSLSRSGLGPSLLASIAGSGGSNPGMLTITKPDGAVVSTVLDGVFVSGSRKMTTATAPAAGWVNRVVANANVPVGTQVLSYTGTTAPYTVWMTAAATGSATGQTVTFTELDLIGVKVISPATGVAAYEGWASGASNPNYRVSRVGGIFSTSGITMRDSTMATDLVGIDATGYRVYSATVEQSTVGGVGGASAPPATPRKWLKCKDSAGTVLVIPAYLAS